MRGKNRTFRKIASCMMSALLVALLLPAPAVGSAEELPKPAAAAVEEPIESDCGDELPAPDILSLAADAGDESDVLPELASDSEATPEPGSSTQPEPSPEPAVAPEPEPESAPEQPVRAFSPASAEQYVTSLSVDTSQVASYGKIRVDLAFSDGSPNEHVFHGGDTIQVSWPTSGDARIKAFSKTVPLVAADGVTYAQAQISSTGVLITFNSNVDAMYDVAGSLWFEAICINDSASAQTVVVKSGSATATVEVGPGASAGEVGVVPDQRKLADGDGGYDVERGIDDEVGDYLMWLDSDDPTYCKWVITFNENRQAGFGSAITITDSIGQGQELDWTQMKVYNSYGDADARNVTVEGTVAEVVKWFNETYGSESSLEVSDAGTLTWVLGRALVEGCAWYLCYTTDIIDFDLDTYTNYARFSFDDAEGAPSVIVDGAGYESLKNGEEIGVAPRGTLVVKKLVEGTELAVPGVAFQLDMRNGDAWAPVATLVTDEAGAARATKLATGDYRLYETEVPDYLEAAYTEEMPYEFHLDNSSAQSVGVSVVVENAVKTGDIEATKMWMLSDGTVDDGEHPTTYFLLYRSSSAQPTPTAVGDVRELADGTTSVEWKSLPLFDVYGNEYVYEVHEVNAAGDDAVPEGYTKEEQGLTVVNTKPVPDTPEVPDTPSTSYPPSEVKATKSVDQVSVSPGENLTYAIVVTNAGDVVAEDIVVKDFVPKNTTFASVGSAGNGKYGCTTDGHEYATWQVARLDPHESVTLTMVVKVNECNDGTPISNTAYYQVSGTPPAPADTPNEPTNSVTTTVASPSVPVQPVRGVLPKTGDGLPLVPLTALVLGVAAVQLGRTLCES